MVDIYESDKFQGTRTYKGLCLLSSLLLNLHVKDILKYIPYNCKIIQFADDVMILCQDKSKDKIWFNLIDTFNQLNTWMLSMYINLELSIQKNVIYVFHRTRGQNFLEFLEVPGSRI